MINLIKNELFKIFKKRSIFILFIFLILFSFFINLVNKKMYSDNSNDKYIEYLKEEIKYLDPNNLDEIDLYLDYKNQIDEYELLSKYDYDSWQYSIIRDKAYDYIYEINNCIYKEKDDKKLKELTLEYDNFKEKLNGDWKVFVYEDLEELKNIYTDDVYYIGQKEILEMRLKYDIPYGNNSLNIALDNYVSSRENLANFEETNKYSDKINLMEIKKNFEVNKYIIENKIEIPSDNSLRGMLINTFSNYGIFIIVGITLIASFVVSEEFNKGTIKLLLVRPYSRNKILCSKFISVIISMLIIIVSVYLVQFIIGGLFYGFSSLSTGVIVYNYNLNIVKTISIFTSIITDILCRLPIYILLLTLTFCISTIINNSGVSMAIALISYIASEIINSFVFYYNVKWLKYFVTVNWDFSQYLYGKLPLIEGMNIMFSIGICLFYFIIMIVPTFIIFNKKNIKNI